jgi:hypothetical protein
MANHRKNGALAGGRGQIVRSKAHVGRVVRVKVKFGDSVIEGLRPSPEAVEINVKRSTDALEQAGKRLFVPGVRLRSKKDVPQFFADDKDPEIIVRRLNGRLQRGRLVNGSFEAID